MSLPDFGGREPSVAELRAEAERLRRQGQKLLDETGLLATFEKYGQVPGIGGSFRYNLMVYPDLDTGIVADHVDRTVVGNLLSDLMTIPALRRVSMSDNVAFISPTNPHAKPKGYWIGLEAPFEGERWGIDCWFQERSWLRPEDSHDNYAEKLEVLDQAGRDAILLLKYQLIQRGEYGGKYTSGDVYDAVLHGARSLAEFERYKAE